MNRWWIALGVLCTMGLAGCKKEAPSGTVSQQVAKTTAPTSSSTAPGGASTEKASGQQPAPTQGDKAAAAAQSAGSQAQPTEGGGGSSEGQHKGPIATVNGKPISADAYYAELDKIKKHAAKIPEDRMKRIKDNILKRLIEAELIKQAVQKEGITVTDAEVDKAFQEYKSRFKTEEQFQSYLKHGKITEADIKKRIREKKALEKLIEKRGSLEVTEQEAREFYEKNKRFYQEKEAVRAAHILIKLAKNAAPEEEKKAKAKLKQVQDALARGEDFAEVARKYSEGPSAPKGGDLGFFTRGQMVKEFEDKAFSMKVGEVSEPVRTRFGYHIIKVLDRREDKQKSFDEVKDQIFESLRNKKFFQQRRQLLEQLHKEAKIEKFAS